MSAPYVSDDNHGRRMRVLQYIVYCFVLLHVYCCGVLFHTSAHDACQGLRGPPFLLAGIPPHFPHVCATIHTSVQKLRRAGHREQRRPDHAAPDLTLQRGAGGNGEY